MCIKQFFLMEWIKMTSKCMCYFYKYYKYYCYVSSKIIENVIKFWRAVLFVMHSLI